MSEHSTDPTGTSIGLLLTIYGTVVSFFDISRLDADVLLWVHVAQGISLTLGAIVFGITIYDRVKKRGK